MALLGSADSNGIHVSQGAVFFFGDIPILHSIIIWGTYCCVVAIVTWKIPGVGALHVATSNFEDFVTGG